MYTHVYIAAQHTGAALIKTIDRECLPGSIDDRDIYK